MASDKLSQKIFDLYKYVEGLKGKDASEPGKAAEILSNVIKELQVQVTELSGAKDELFRDLSGRECDNIIRECKRFHTLAQAAFEGIVFTKNGRIIEANEQFAKSHGYELSEVIGKSVTDFVSPEDRERVRRSIECGQEHIGEYHSLRKDGSVLLLEAHGYLIEEDDGPVRVGVLRDITERKRAEEEIKNLAKFPEENPNPIIRVAANGTIIYANPSSSRLLESWGCQVGQMMPEDYRNLIQETLRSGNSKEIEATSGDTIYSLVLASVVDMGYVNIYGRDITEHKKDEEKLRLAYSRLQTFFNHRIGGIGIVIANANGSILQANDYYLRILGCTRDELLSGQVDWRKMTPPEWLPADQRALTQLQEQGICDTYEKEYERRDGTRVPVLITDAMMPGDSGDILAFVLDITRRKRAEGELKASEERTRNQMTSLQAVLDATPAIIWIAHDPECRNISGNRAAYEFSRVSVGTDMSKTGSEPEKLAHYRIFKDGVELAPGEMPIQQVAATGRALINNAIDFHFDYGAVRSLIGNVTPILDASGKPNGVVAAYLDITELKQMENELRRSKDELELRVQERTVDLEKTNEELMKAKDAAEEAVRAKAAFLANMSHEIRTPLNSVIGFTSLLLEDNLSPEHRDYIDSIRANGEALLDLINDILDYSKLEKEKIELEIHPFDLRQSIEEALDFVSTKAAEKGLDLAYTIDNNVPETIITDPARLRQVLANLLSNAVKYTDHGEIILSISSKLRGEGYELHFAVQDTGIGMPKNQMGKLFQPFSQIRASTSRLNEGTGLGLAISRRLVELMGGRIWAESEEGKGSTFHFTIKAMAESQSGNKKVPTGPQPHLAKRSVLILDDNKTIRRLLAHQVQSWGMVPVIFSSGSEALERILKGVVPDVAILDAGMPNMDGITVAETIRRYGIDLPLIMLTFIGQYIPQHFFAARLEKPIKLMRLYDTLTDVLSGRPIREQNQAVIADPTSISPLRILIAEDNISSQKVTMMMLRRLGYRADLAANGVEVLQALERQPYDVVLMDVRMPEMDGLEATRQIRQRWPNNGLRIIAITAYALQGDKERCLEAGMDDYISKPMKINELADALSRCPPYPKNKI